MELHTKIIHPSIHIGIITIVDNSTCNHRLYLLAQLEKQGLDMYICN